MDFINRVPPQGGYRPDLYCPMNIIGYTGSIHNNPTVYFLNATYYGHITQDHDEKWNIGRQGVGDRIIAPGFHYEIKNYLRNGIEVGGEFGVADDGSWEYRAHPCRGKYIDCSRKGMKTFALLSQAIWRFPAKKGEEPRGRGQFI